MLRFLFQPFRLRSLTIRNRIICGPMEKNLCTAEGVATDRYADYVEERARGEAGLILLESAYVDLSGKARRLQMGIHDDAVVLPLRRLIDRAHRHGAAVGVQLHHGGRTCQEAVSGIQPIAPSPVPCKVLAGGDIPRQMTLSDIRHMVGQFGRAALRSMEAGADAVEIHGAHGYLVGQFLSPYSNRRSDVYGGSFSSRCRFPLEVIRAVRNAVGPDFPILYRISADEFIDSGLTLEDTIRFALILQSQGIDLLDISAGIYESGFMMVQPMEFPPGGYVYMARAFKEAVRIPVSVAGRIADVHQAEGIIADGSADLVTMTRAFHADPHFPRKAREGRFNEICMCIGCNQGCTDRLRENVPLSCILNPRSGFEQELGMKPAVHQKTVWVAGGGPAGLMAGGLAALRGHRVTIFEKESEPGGMIRFLRRIEHKADFGQGIRFLIDDALRSGARFEMGVCLDGSRIRKDPPDVLVIASGSRPGMISLPGFDGLPIYDFLQALERPQVLGRSIVVYGGGMIGAETAFFLAGRGHRITLVEPGEEIVTDLGPRAKWYLIRKLRQHPHLSVMTHTRIAAREANRLILEQPSGTFPLDGVDGLVIALERVPDRSLVAEIEGEKTVGGIFLVGDCKKPGRVTEATFEAARIAASI